MGLAMVHGIVHEHGGHIVVETRARPRITLQGAVAGGGSSPRKQRPGLRNRRHARQPRPALEGTVLVVDDEVAVGEFMRELLETRGLTATFVPGPAGGAELVTTAPGRFDVVITDQSMPRMTGCSWPRRCRHCERTCR